MDQAEAWLRAREQDGDGAAMRADVEDVAAVELLEREEAVVVLRHLLSDQMLCGGGKRHGWG